MGTGVIIDSYEIRNPHTVALLDLSRSRGAAARGATQKDQGMATDEVLYMDAFPESLVSAWATSYHQNGVSLAQLARDNDISTYKVRTAIDFYIADHPEFLRGIYGNNEPTAAAAAAPGYVRPAVVGSGSVTDLIVQHPDDVHDALLRLSEYLQGLRRLSGVGIAGSVEVSLQISLTL